MRGTLVLATALLVSSFSTAVVAAEQTDSAEAVAQWYWGTAPLADQPLIVPFFEHSRPVLVTDVPLPQARPANVIVARPAAQPTPAAQRPLVARAPDVVARPVAQPQRVAFDVKAKSPLFWMTVGAGF